MNKSKGGLEIQQVIFNAHVFTLCCSRNVYKSIPDSLDIFIPGWVRMPDHTGIILLLFQMGTKLVYVHNTPFLCAK